MFTPPPLPTLHPFFPCQQAERRPQTRPDSESYEKARDYFSEGKQPQQYEVTKRQRTVLVALNLFCRQFAVINPDISLHPCSTEKAARWWLFQESSLPWLPVSHDPGPHQPLPFQRLAVPECQNCKCACVFCRHPFPHFCRTRKR